MRLSVSPRSRILVLGALLLSLGAVLAGALGTQDPKSATPALPDASNSAPLSLAASPGVLVTAVESGSPAEKAGIVRGDIVIQAEGKAVDTPADLRQALSAKKAGDKVTLTIRHGDTVKTVTATLADRGGAASLGISISGPGVGRGGMRGPGSGGGPGFFGFGDGIGAASAAYVASVVAGSPAEKAGITQGDLILSVDGTAVDAKNGLADLIAAKKVGDTVVLSVQTDGAAPRDMKVALAKNPDKDGPYMGVQYSMVGRLQAGTLGTVASPGVFVAEVAGGSPADKAGIKAQDVITKVSGTAVADPRQVVDAVAAKKPGDTLVVTVFRGGKETDITVTLGQSPSDASKAWVGLSMTGGPVLRGAPGIAPQGRGFGGGMGGERSITPFTPRQGPPTI
jgi:S1-C subfamily serine protease